MWKCFCPHLKQSEQMEKKADIAGFGVEACAGYSGAALPALWA